MQTQFPKVIFGTSSLGNLYTAPPQETKTEIVKEIIQHSQGTPVFDSAGKYGAGLALESLGSALKSLNISPDAVQISNKLGWKRKKLVGSEPTFEPGVWKNLDFDAEQSIDYDGILACFHEGNSLLRPYTSRLASIHDPDEYLAHAKTEEEHKQKLDDILGAYEALKKLKQDKHIDAIGIGAKNPKIIALVSQYVKLDWAMFACCITPYSHNQETFKLVKSLSDAGTVIINSAVFNAGFLIGQDTFDYQAVSRESHTDLFEWRDTFHRICDEFDVSPAEACVQFSFLVPGIQSIALNTSSPKRVRGNIALTTKHLPCAFWHALFTAKLIQLPL